MVVPAAIIYGPIENSNWVLLFFSSHNAEKRRSFFKYEAKEKVNNWIQLLLFMKFSITRYAIICTRFCHKKGHCERAPKQNGTRKTCSEISQVYGGSHLISDAGQFERAASWPSPFFTPLYIHKVIVREQGLPFCLEKSISFFPAFVHIFHAQKVQAYFISWYQKNAQMHTDLILLH